MKGERELPDPSSAEEYACLTILNWIETSAILPVLFFTGKLRTDFRPLLRDVVCLWTYTNVVVAVGSGGGIDQSGRRWLFSV